MGAGRSREGGGQVGLRIREGGEEGAISTRWTLHFTKKLGDNHGNQGGERQLARRRGGRRRGCDPPAGNGGAGMRPPPGLGSAGVPVRGVKESR